mgnify:CR=1 FL=1
MEDISLHLLDLAQNSLSAGATLIELLIQEDSEKGTMTIVIQDNGYGMDEKQVRKITDPFFTTRSTRKVGLGIPLFQASAEATGGQLHIISCLDVGTKIEAIFHTDHIDCLPLGKIDDTITTLIYLNPGIDFIYSHKKNDKQLLLDTREIRSVIGDISIANLSVIDWIKRYLIEGLKEINGGV